MGAPLFDLGGRTALVTGGSGGVGSMIAAGLLGAGARVYVTSRKPDAAERAARELSVHGDARPLVADLSTEDGCVALARAVADREPALHVLVNNAGATKSAPLEEFPDTAWDRVLDLNVRGVFHLTRALLPLLRAGSADGDPTRVINIGSIHGIRVPRFHNYAYSASKAAVHMLTRHLAAELAPVVTVNAVAPGMFRSRMTEKIMTRYGDQVARQVPMRRIGAPDDLAGIAVFLAGRASSFITGAVIPVDGGASTLS